MVFLCIDAGTTNLKAALVSNSGEFIDISNKDIAISMPEIGVCEMDMNDHWDSLCQVLDALHRKNPSVWTKIQGIGICAQGDGAWMLDENHQPVRSAVLWNDTRPGTLASEELTRINKICVEKNVTPLFAGAFPIILQWLKKHEPENYHRTRWILHCKDWINYKLTGNISTDITDASTSIFDIFEKKYRTEILDLLDISEVRECLPEVLESSAIMGAVSEEIAGRFGIRQGVPVIAGAIDVLSVATGCDLTGPGQKGSILGTTLCNFVVLDEALAKKCKGEMGSVLCHTKPGLYIRQMSALSGASTLDWVRKEIAQGMPYAEMETLLKEIPLGSSGVMFLPFLFGERAPLRLPNANAVFLGLRVNHTKFHMVRAAFEGLSMALYDCYQYLPASRPGLTVAGGGARNEFLCQMICDTLGEPVIRNHQKELGILGVSKLLSDAFEGNPIQSEPGPREIHPNLKNHESYMEIYDRYQRYQNLMKPFWS